jgi:hypothetical protein
MPNVCWTIPEVNSVTEGGYKEGHTNAETSSEGFFVVHAVKTTLLSQALKSARFKRAILIT